MFPRVTREPRLSDKVADLLLETIVARRLEPGERLPSERELGEQFGVSRTVVREAVRTRSRLTARSSTGSPPATPRVQAGRCAPTSRTSRSTGGAGRRAARPP